MTRRFGYTIQRFARVAPLLPLLGFLMGIECCQKLDQDGDGWTVFKGDCDDQDAAINPGALEACDGIDNNCDGLIDEGFDVDADGLADCFDVEECDGIDNNGDGQIDEGFDVDGDGYTSCGKDCDDTDATVYPGADELCNGLDDDCDGDVPKAELDMDGDGFTACAMDGEPADCDDGDPEIYPGAYEDPLDGIDNDCNGAVDELYPALLYTMVTPCTLTVIDTATLTQTAIGSIGAGGEDFAFSVEGILYSSADRDYCGVHGSADGLYTVDTATGAGAFLGPIGYSDVDALAFAPDGTLYAADARTDQLLRVDPVTGAGTVIGPIGYPFIGGMAFSADGILYGTDITGGGGGPSTLLTLDTKTGAGAEIGPVGFSTVEGIAFTADGTLFGISDYLGGGTGQLIVIDLETGEGSAIMQVITSGNMDGLAAAP